MLRWGLENGLSLATSEESFLAGRCGLLDSPAYGVRDTICGFLLAASSCGACGCMKFSH